MSPGMASRGVHSTPNRSAKGAKRSGPNEKPSVPPVMWTDMASPGRVPPSRCASAAAGGWKAAPPRPPAKRISASMGFEDARPMRLSTATARTGPAITRTRGRHESASRPNPTCDTDAAIWYSIVSVPAAASDKPSRGMRSGRSGA